MANPGLIEALEKIASPVIEAYHDDLRVHDARILEDAGKGDVFLWAPRQCGTFLVVLARAFHANRRAREHYDAIRSTSGRPMDWYLIGIDRTEREPKWTVSPCPDHVAIVARWDERARIAGAETVSEVHL